MLYDITNPPDSSLGVPKFSANDLILQDFVPQIVFCSSQRVSLLLPTCKAFYSDVYVQIEKTQVAPFPLFDVTSKDLAKCSAGADSTQCCSKVYYIVSRQRVYSPSFPHDSCLYQNQVDIQSFQVIIPNLNPGTEYFLTLYTPDLRFPPVKLRTPDVAPMLQESMNEV